MYTVKCIRDGYGNFRHRLYDKKFHTLSELAGFLESFPERVYKVVGLTNKERWILWNKCFAIEKRRKNNNPPQYIGCTEVAQKYRYCF